MMTETSLDVLSRAATMVKMEPEKNRSDLKKSNGSLAEVINTDCHKQLPSRANRQRRSAERQDISQALNFDDGHRRSSPPPPQPPQSSQPPEVTSNLCTTGTQTVLVGVKALEDSELVGIPQDNPALPTDSSSALTSAPSIANQPTGIFGVVRPHQLRPSVITCAPAPQRDTHSTIRTSSNTFRPNGYTNAQTNSTFRQEITSSGFCDPVIEEHFRRSLGKDYKDKMSSNSPRSPRSPPLEVADDKEVNITGSVDDHFAKALGEQWTNIKNNVVDAQRKASPPTTPSPPPTTLTTTTKAPAAQMPSLVPVGISTSASRKL